MESKRLERGRSRAPAYLIALYCKYLDLQKQIAAIDAAFRHNQW
jgi:hypothetical protein